MSEQALRARPQRMLMIAGVDEAGRGPLAGPVVAAAVILNPARPIAGLDDSKKLDAATRSRLALQIRAHALYFAVASADHHEIDRINILQATLLAMRRALQGLALQPAQVWVDGNCLPDVKDFLPHCELRAIVRGDASEACISAASILAKTHRDALMEQVDAQYPEYGFAVHKGYPTARHIKMLQLHGVTPIHRRSFAPVRLALTP